MSDLVTVTEAARELALNKSTVSRQVSRLGIGKDHRGRFSLREYIEARDGGLNPLMARHNGAGGGQEAAGTADAEDGDDPLEQTAAAPGDTAARRPGFTDAKTVEAAWKAKKAQLDYEERVGRLVAKADVEAAAFQWGRRFRDAVLRLPRDRADELAGIDDPREMATRLEAMLRETLDRVVGELVSEPDGAGGDE